MPLTTETPAPTVAAASGLALPFVALVAGAVAMAISPTFVRLAEVGPFASAFWRAFLALPVLYLWARAEARQAGRPTPGWRNLNVAVVFAGLVFAGDLFFWHLAILKTTIANATLLATMAPVWVAIGSGLVLGERVDAAGWSGLGLAVVGAAFLIGTSYTLAPDRLTGDLFGIATSIFFGGYFLAIRAARRHAPPGEVTLLSTAVSAAVMFAVAIALEDTLIPIGFGGVAALIGLALVSHVGGQGLLTYALGHLPAAFSALVIFLEALAAAFFAWLFLGEAVTSLQAGGGALIIAGIVVARPRRPAAGPGMPS